MFFKNPMTLHELETRVFSDVEPTQKIQGIYIFAQTVENQFSPLITATRLWKEKRVEVILSNEQVRHSQGILQGKRKNFIHTEYKRIIMYHEKGDLVSCEEILSYLERRNKRQLMKGLP